MCGIAGVFRFSGDQEELSARLGVMNQAQIHRGPDEGHIHVEPDMASGLAVRRLSIVDPEGGSQPMFSEDGSVAVVCNGEIYNHRALQSELERKGYRFRGHADTEVLAHLYQEEGVDFLQRLKGMFALALIDRKRKRLLLARDRIGMKHLYWSQTARGLVFASEVRALAQSGFVSLTPDWASLNKYFSLGWIQSPGTAFENVNRLRPGSYIMLDQDNSRESVRETRYWAPRFEQPREERSLEDYSEELGSLLRAAVGTHLDTDVPVGLYLSGGWDSSLVSLYAAEASREPLNSYSIHFPDDAAADESGYFRAVADQIGTKSHELVLRDADIRDVHEQTVSALEEPVASCPTVLGYRLAEAAGRDLKVVLGGEGADELFAGYPRFENSLLHRIRRLVPPVLVPASLPADPKWSRALRFLAAGDDEQAQLQLNSRQSPHHYAGLFSADIPFEPGPGPGVPDIPELTRASFRDLLDLQLSVDLTGRLADGILFMLDKTSMAHSLEVRMPFLDQDVVEFAHRLPSKFKVQGRQMKRVLAPLAQHLPPAVAARRKQGLQVPPRMQSSDAQRAFHVETILETSLASGLFRHGELERWVTGRVGNKHPQAVPLETLSNFCLWWNQFVRSGTARGFI